MKNEIFIKEKEKYQTCWSSGKYRQSTPSQSVAKIIEHLKPEKVLDLGCGNGYVVSKLVDKKIDAYGIDITSSAWITKSLVNPQFNILKDRLIEGSIWDMPFKKNEFDVSFSTTLLEHIPEEMVNQTIKEILKVTKEKTIHYIDTKQPQNQFGYKVHMTIKPVRWWINKFAEFNDKKIKVIIKDKKDI